MEAIVGLILAGVIFRTSGTWQGTRLLSLVYVVFAIFLDFTPLRYPLQSFNRWVLTALAVTWLINVIVVRRSITRA